MDKYIKADELKRAIFFNDYSPLVIDENSNAAIFQVLRLIDAAPALEEITEEEVKGDLAKLKINGYPLGYLYELTLMLRARAVSPSDLKSHNEAFLNGYKLAKEDFDKAVENAINRILED